MAHDRWDEILARLEALEHAVAGRGRESGDEPRGCGCCDEAVEPEAAEDEQEPGCCGGAHGREPRGGRGRDFHAHPHRHHDHPPHDHHPHDHHPHDHHPRAHRGHRGHHWHRGPDEDRFGPRQRRPQDDEKRVVDLIVANVREHVSEAVEEIVHRAVHEIRSALDELHDHLHEQGAAAGGQQQAQGGQPAAPGEAPREPGPPKQEG